MPAKGNKLSRPQRPVKRARAGRAPGTPKGQGFSRLRAYLPSILLVALCVLVLGVVGVLYYAATSSSFFQAREITITGNVRTSTEDIRAVIARHTANAGVWHADLGAISAELNRLPWVSQATVGRVLPDGLRVSIKERAKSAVILPANGKPTWVDAEGVKLGPYAAADKVPNLILLKGWNEADTPEARAENRQRMQVYQAALAEWEAKGLSKRISDVDLSNTEDVRVALRSNPEVPIMLGDRNWGARLSDAVQTLEQEHRSDITSLDTKLDGQVIVAYRQALGPATGAGDRARPAPQHPPKPTSPKPGSPQR